MWKITVTKDKNADTRTSEKVPTMAELFMATRSHQDDVRNVMKWFCHCLTVQADSHDWTKIANIDSFHHDFVFAKENNDVKFTELPWYKMHVQTERHHLNEHEPHDVNLFDVLERIADITAAAMARNGKFKWPAYIDRDMLARAYENTIRMVLNRIEVKEK